VRVRKAKRSAPRRLMNRAAMAGSCMKVSSHGQTEHQWSSPSENGGADDDMAKDNRTTYGNDGGEVPSDGG
jgi:hypothetical protein